jgi:hypothetical protein
LAEAFTVLERAYIGNAKRANHSPLLPFEASTLFVATRIDGFVVEVSEVILRSHSAPMRGWLFNIAHTAKYLRDET